MQVNPTVILTRQHEDNLELSKLLHGEGIPVIEYPCIQTTLLPFPNDSLINGKELKDFHVIVFTSKRGVQGMKNVYSSLALYSARGLQIAVVGEKTAEAVRKNIGVEPTIIAKPSTGESLAKHLIQFFPTETQILYIRGNKTTHVFEAKMKAAGYSITELIVYQNKVPPMKPLSNVNNGIIVFASPSAVKGFLKNNDGHALLNIKYFLAIGSVTANYLKELGIKEIIVSRKPDSQYLFFEVKKLIEKEE